MKCSFKLKNDLVIEVEEKDQRSLFEKLAEVQEIFGVKKCERCGGTEIKFVVREVEGNKYYELQCQNEKCRARLQFGCHKVGNSLFPKRFEEDADGKRKFIGKGGWGIFDPQTKTMK